MDYSKLNDYELIYQVNDNNEIAYKTIFDKYSILVNKLAFEFYKKSKMYGVDFDDLKQEGFVAISKAIHEYDGKSALFYTYVYVCVKREMEKYLKTFFRIKHKSLNEAISLSDPIINDNINNLCFEDVLASSYDVEENVLYSDILQKIYLHKNDFEYPVCAIYELLLNNFNEKEISILLDIPYRSVGKYTRKIRLSIKKFYKLKYC